MVLIEYTDTTRCKPFYCYCYLSMAIFPKTPSSKELFVQVPSISKLLTDSSKSTPFLGCPLALSDSLSIESLSMLTRIDVYRLRHAHTQSPVVPFTFFYYDDVISKPALSDAKSLIKQKKETDLLLYSLGLGGLTQQEYISILPEFSSRVGSLFAKLFAKWCIKNTYQSVYRNTRYQTIAPPENVKFEIQDMTAYTVKYFVSTKNHSLDVYIEDASTMFWDVAIAFNPLHKKAKLLKGQMAIIPIINKTIPIILDDRVDFASHGGIMRITPAHDDLSLSIAKDHDLPLNVESYDSYGNFSEHAGLFAGKPVDQFLGNIIQNLSDIGNLIDKHPITRKIPYSRITNEKLITRTHKGRFLEIPETIMQSFLNDEKTRECFGDNLPEVSHIFPVSTPSLLGYRLPVWTKEDDQTIIVEEDTIIDAFVEKKPTKNKILISLFVFHAIQEWNLNPRFVLEDAITCFFSPGFIKDQTLLGGRIELYKTRYPQYAKEVQELEQTIKILTDDVTNESAINTLLAILENAFALSVDKQGIFSFDLTQMDAILANATQSKETISTYLLHHFLVLDACGFFDNQNITALPITLFSEQERQKFASCTLLAYLLEDKFPWSKSLFYTPVAPNKSTTNRDVQTIKSHIQTYWSDIVRWHLMDAHHAKTAHSEEALQETMELLHTFWNASRFIKTSFFDEQESFGTLEALYDKILWGIDDIHAFDNWLIWVTQSLLEDIKTIEHPVDIAAFSHRLLQFMKEDFSTKYIELIKTIPSVRSHDISLLVAGILIKLFFPYAPLMTSDLWQKMWFDGNITDPFPDNFFPGLQKSYLISLFMDLVDKFVSLKAGLSCKKHDPVSIFIKANPDFLKFCQSHETLLQKTLHADDITYLPYNEHAPSSYIQEDIIDITIGIKRFSKDNPFCLAALTKKLAEKQDYLQYVRNLLSSLNNNWWSPEIITKKREEIQSVKDEIEQLELEIQKLKMNS